MSRMTTSSTPYVSQNSLDANLCTAARCRRRSAGNSGSETPPGALSALASVSAQTPATAMAACGASRSAEGRKHCRYRLDVDRWGDRAVEQRAAEPYSRFERPRRPRCRTRRSRSPASSRCRGSRRPRGADARLGSCRARTRSDRRAAPRTLWRRASRRPPGGRRGAHDASAGCRRALGRRRGRCGRKIASSRRKSSASFSGAQYWSSIAPMPIRIRFVTAARMPASTCGLPLAWPSTWCSPSQ